MISPLFTHNVYSGNLFYYVKFLIGPWTVFHVRIVYKRRQSEGVKVESVGPD